MCASANASVDGAKTVQASVASLFIASTPRPLGDLCCVASDVGIHGDDECEEQECVHGTECVPFSRNRIEVITITEKKTKNVKR